jgi:hypothetical protein
LSIAHAVPDVNQIHMTSGNFVIEILYYM